MLQPGAAEKRVARALSLAVQQPTLAHGPEAPFLQLHTILRELFPQLFSLASVQRVDGRALLLHLPGTGAAQPLLFLSHLDVAPIRSPESWSAPPFSGEIQDGFVYGRGTADMKGHLIALLTAAESLLNEGVRPRADLYFALSCDEEIRGPSMQHICQLLMAQNVKPAFVLDEGGSITALQAFTQTPTAMVGVCEKGRMSFSLTADGEGGMEALLRASERLLRMHFAPRICPATEQMLSGLSGEMAGYDRFCAAHPRLMKRPLLRRLDRTHYGRALTRTQLMISAMGGDALRGERARITFQASILPGDSASELLRRIERVIGDTRILITIDHMDEPSVLSPIQGTAWEALTTAIHVHFPGMAIAPYLLTGASDARRTEPICPYIYRFSPFLLPPDELNRMHHPNERISIENLLRGSAFFRQMLMA